MARPQKQTVDYFPHFASRGKTKFILESKYGNDGYALWFKLLELLCESNGQYYDCSEVSEWEYLVALAKIDSAKVKDILDMLSEMGNIDGELWKNHKVIWCQALVDNITDAYRKRTVSVPQKPTFEEFPQRKLDINEVSGSENPQIKLNNIKPNEIKEKNKKNSGVNPTEISKRFIPPTIEEVKAYCEKRKNGVDPQKWYNFYSAKGWMIGKNKMKNWEAAVRTWEKPKDKEVYTNGTGVDRRHNEPSNREYNLNGFQQATGDEEWGAGK